VTESAGDLDAVLPAGEDVGLFAREGSFGERQRPVTAGPHGGNSECFVHVAGGEPGQYQSRAA